MEQIIIDENTGSPFPSRITLVGFDEGQPESTEGYHHNDLLIMETTRKLAKTIDLRPGQRSIDVGYGSNLSVALALYELGAESYGLDRNDGLDHQKYPNLLCVPPHFNKLDKGIKKYCGMAEELLHSESELKDKKFDLFMFWGSWESGGYNFAIGGEIGWFRAVQELEGTYGPIYLHGGTFNPYDNPEVDKKMAENKEKIIKDAKSMLNPNGGIMIVSSRYSRHGAGFTTNQLPWEKRVNLKLAHTFADMGARELYLWGVSKESVKRQLSVAESIDEKIDKKVRKNVALMNINEEGAKKSAFNDLRKLDPMVIQVRGALLDESFLFALNRGICEPKYKEKTISQIKDMKIPLGRIDAIYGRF